MIEILLEAERQLSFGLLDQAEHLYRQAADADPRNSIAVVGLARVALERGDEARALELAERALGIDPDNEAARRMAERLREVAVYRGGALGVAPLARIEGKDEPGAAEPEPAAAAAAAEPASEHDVAAASQREPAVAGLHAAAPEPEAAASQPEVPAGSLGPAAATAPGAATEPAAATAPAPKPAERESAVEASPQPSTEASSEPSPEAEPGGVRRILAWLRRLFARQ